MSHLITHLKRKEKNQHWSKGIYLFLSKETAHKEHSVLKKSIICDFNEYKLYNSSVDFFSKAHT